MRGFLELKARLASSRRLLLGLDFDGTLVPFVSHSRLARLPKDIGRILAKLRDRPGLKVAIVSGRSLKNVRSKVGLSGFYYIGNHGLELSGPGLSWRRLKQSPPGLNQAARSLRRAVKGIPGVRVEHKGLSLSLHYRAAPKAAKALRKMLKPILRRHPRLRLSSGKSVFEVRPRLNWDKGRALKKLGILLKGNWTLALVGDDRTDEEGFRSLGPNALSVRVGNPKTSFARFRIKDRQQVRSLLQFMDEVAL